MADRETVILAEFGNSTTFSVKKKSIFNEHPVCNLYNKTMDPIFNLVFQVAIGLGKLTVYH